MSVNKNICAGTVLTVDSLTETFTEYDGEGNPPYDPEGTEIETPKYTDELEDAVLEAAMELEGDERAVALCRGLYDLNELEGGFCCATLSIDYGIEGMDVEYDAMLTTATSVKKQNEDPLEVPITMGD